MSTAQNLWRFEGAARDTQHFAMSDAASSATGLQIFRAGTFKDSRGVASTWTVAHLNTMAANFKTLKDSGVFPNVPVRVDHSGSANSVVGWLSNVYVQGNFLVGDIEFTEPDAAQKYERGTYKNRSIELGKYETNGDNPKTYDPTVMGLAFVDIPAVEGLHGRASDVSVFHLVEDTKVMQVFKIKGQDVSDAAAVQASIIDLEKQAGAAAFTFKLHGAEDTSDFAKVQAHIVALEAERDSKVVAERQAFVKQLATDGKIGEAQSEMLTEVAVGMSPDQFEKFSKGYENAPKLTLFEKHGGNGVQSQGGAGSDPAAEAIKTAEATVDQLRRSGAYSAEALKNTQAFKRLTELKTAK